jgi:arylsulfatase A-like enzyme
MEQFMRILARLFWAVIFAASCLAGEKPNVIVILSDDIGYGDLGCYGATKVKTPQLDRMATEGLRFTSGYAASATCTPTRYAMLTGEYAWRRKGTGILPGDAAPIIESGRFTLPTLMKNAGYTTAAVGKWHLGLGPGPGKTNWNVEIKPGPREIGFDYSFLIPATGDRTPCVYVENQLVVGLDANDPIEVSYDKAIGNDPTGAKNPELLKMKLTHGHDNTIVNGISRIGYMTGGKAARWVDEDMADVITRKAVEFIEKNKEQPFFLYFATHDIHVPRAPHKRFVGTSQCGTRGDMIHQLDYSVGEVMAALDRLNLSEKTLVIFSSDNGPVLDDGYADGAVKDLNGHTPAGALRGGKYSLFEGGTRLPFIARWKGRIKPGVSDAMVCLIDLLNSLAKLTGQTLPADAAPDSLDVLPALLGESQVGREYIVQHANGVSIRKGNWKFVPASSNQKAKNAVPDSLFDLSNDIGETKNLAEKPEVLAELKALLEKIKTDNRTRPQ